MGLFGLMYAWNRNTFLQIPIHASKLPVSTISIWLFQWLFHCMVVHMVKMCWKLDRRYQNSRSDVTKYVWNLVGLHSRFAGNLFLCMNKCEKQKLWKFTGIMPFLIPLCGRWTKSPPFYVGQKTKHKTSVMTMAIVLLEMNTIFNTTLHS